MPKDVIDRFDRALEEEFFRRIDDELANSLREKWKHDRDLQSLQKETQIADTVVLEELLYVGIEPGCLPAMTLVPAIQVVWANGFVEPMELEAVIETAKGAGILPDSIAGDLLLTWLQCQPTPELFQVWEDYITALKPIVKPESYRHLREQAVSTAESVALAAGGDSGVHAISAAEQRVINKIRDAFGASE